MIKSLEEKKVARSDIWEIWHVWEADGSGAHIKLNIKDSDGACIAARWHTIFASDFMACNTVGDERSNVSISLRHL